MTCMADRSIAQLVEFWSPKPAVGGSIPSAPAIKFFVLSEGKLSGNDGNKEVFFFLGRG